MSDETLDSELIYELEADPPPAEKFLQHYNMYLLALLALSHQH